MRMIRFAPRQRRPRAPRPAGGTAAAPRPFVIPKEAPRCVIPCQGVGRRLRNLLAGARSQSRSRILSAWRFPAYTAWASVAHDGRLREPGVRDSATGYEPADGRFLGRRDSPECRQGATRRLLRNDRRSRRTSAIQPRCTPAASSRRDCSSPLSPAPRGRGAGGEGALSDAASCMSKSHLPRFRFRFRLRLRPYADARRASRVQAAARCSSRSRSRAFCVSDAARSSSARASSRRPSLTRKSPRTAGSR
jgi:hypothetical protein